VNFVISEPTDLDIELSDKVRKRYGLKSALVLKGPDQPTSALTEAFWDRSRHSFSKKCLKTVIAGGSHGAGLWRLPPGL